MKEHKEQPRNYRIAELTALFLMGSILYLSVEILFRGYSHWSMAILGGLCFVIIGELNEHAFSRMPLLYQMLISTIVVTVLEFITGLIVNVWLGWGVWDYSDLPFNIMGQICLPFSIMWFFLALFAILVDDAIRHWGFEEPLAQYYSIRGNQIFIFEWIQMVGRRFRDLFRKK